MQIRGLSRLQKQIDIIKDYAKRGADPLMKRYAQREVQRMTSKAYPQELPDQKYVRTFELKRSFASRKIAPSKYAISNDRKGAKWVIKRGMQNKRYHLGRWWTLDDELEKGLPVLAKQMAADVEGIMDNA